jgi:acyl-CoA thioester hydrolase
MPPRGEGFTVELRVRTNECDMQGIVFNANYLVYAEVALNELWRELFGSYHQLVSRGHDLLMVDSHLSYRAPAKADDLLDITLAVSQIGNTSLAMHLSIDRSGTTVADGQLVYVFVDPATWAKISPSEPIRLALARYELQRETP